MGPLWLQVALALLSQFVGARDEEKLDKEVFNRFNNKEVVNKINNKEVFNKINNKEVVTLKTPGAFLETLGKERDSLLNVSVEVRTYQQSGLILCLMRV